MAIVDRQAIVSGSAARIGQMRGSGEVRSALPQDLDALVALCREHAAFEQATFDADGYRSRLASALFCDPPRLLAWVAVVAGQPVGYATAAVDYSTWSARDYLHLDCLFLRPENRNTGVGAALLTAVTSFARDSGHHEIQWPTPAWNLDAARFYRHQGAVDQVKLRFVLRCR